MILLGKLPPEPPRFLLTGDCTAPSGPQDDDDCKDSHDDPVPVCKLLVTAKHSAGLLCFLTQDSFTIWLFLFRVDLFTYTD